MDGTDTEHLREQAWELLAPGFTRRVDVVVAMRELAEDDGAPGVSPDAAEAVVHELWDRRERYLATEPARRPTDDRRVADAFTVLAASGLMAEMNLGFDQGEGSAECEALARRDGRDGYVFFHQQDAARLAHRDATLYLGFDAVPAGRSRFGSREEYDAAAVTVGHRVAGALVAHGLDVRWNASPTARIEVARLDWRRPLPV